MIACRACGGWIDENAVRCPDCGMPNALRRQTGGWFSSQGRITVREYWWYYAVPIGLADLFSGAADAAMHAGGILDGVATVVTLFASIAGTTKRLHDRGHSGWMQLTVLIPVFGWIWIFVELSRRGTAGRNSYGADPQAGRR